MAGFAEPLGTAGAEEVERRAQELLNEWFKFYFSGVPFQTPVGSGSEAKTFPDCEILWGQATPSMPAVKPILHLLLADRRDGTASEVGKNLWRNQGQWTWNALLRVSPQLPVNPGVANVATDVAQVEAERACRRIGDQCRWLLASAHIQELAVKGIGRLKIENGPRVIPAGSWHLRQIVFTTEMVWHHRTNRP